MSDIFLEQTVTRKNERMTRLLYLSIWALLIVTALYTLISLYQIITVTEQGIAISIIPAVMAVLLGGVTFFLFRIKDRFIVEYDYALTNTVLDVSKIMNGKRRKYMMELDIRTVTEAGNAGSGRYKLLLSQTDTKKYDFTLNKESEKMYFRFQKNNNNYLVVIEPSREIWDAILSRKMLPQGAWNESK